MNDQKRAPSTIISGIPAAPGLAAGRSFILQPQELKVPRSTGNDSQHETQRLQNARQKGKIQLENFVEYLSTSNHGSEADIFSAHCMFIDDVALLKVVEKSLQTGLNAEAAWMDAIEAFAVQLESLPDKTLQARAVDVRDAGKRVLCILLDVQVNDLYLEEPSVVIASDLTPSQTAALDRDKVVAFCIEGGGPTSHTAILSKALGIPAVVGLGPMIMKAEPGSLVLVNGNLGEVTLAPDEHVLADFSIAIENSLRQTKAALTASSQPAVTIDGFQPQVYSNIGGVDDAASAVENGAEGVGLFRTEFLFLERRELPTEEEQIQVYRKVFDRLGGLPVVVRTLDIGGDKAVSYLGLTREANPFLGWRAIRMNTDRPDVFSGQVRALLQAGAGRDLRIMLPMVSNLEEITEARRLFNEAAESLHRQDLPCSVNVQFGVMVEIPSAALIADRLAEQVDFFSIGTNDLTQYTLAADRTNPRVAAIASPYHPAVLRLIQLTIEAAHRHQKWAGVCGELAGDVIAVPLLLGLGLDEFSMAPAMIPAVKQAIRKCETAVCRRIASECLAMTTISEVISFLSSEAEKLALL